jgi:hypothetical protein|tara:strand:- start:180 stop:575 length:396 start_codon:yes stop_codon:yes gene_type:complete
MGRDHSEPSKKAVRGENYTIQIFIINSRGYNPKKVNDLVSSFVEGRYNPSRIVLEDDGRIYSPMHIRPPRISFPPFIHVYGNSKDSVIIEVKDREEDSLVTCKEEELKSVAKGLLKFLNKNNFRSYSLIKA